MSVGGRLDSPRETGAAARVEGVADARGGDRGLCHEICWDIEGSEIGDCTVSRKGADPCAP